MGFYGEEGDGNWSVEKIVAHEMGSAAFDVQYIDLLDYDITTTEANEAWEMMQLATVNIQFKEVDHG